MTTMIDRATKFLDFASENGWTVPTELLEFMIGEDDDHCFFKQPASTKYHGAYEGGLFDHSMAVAKRLVDMTKANGLNWQRPESAVKVAFLHDLCKIDSYRKTEEGYEYNPDSDRRHAEKSIELAKQFETLTEEEELCIRFHMGAYVKEDWTGFDAAIRQYETVLWTHQADMLASKVDGK